MAFRNRLFWWKLKGWLKQTRHRLYRYRPRFRERNFWAVQFLVLVLVVVHNVFESGEFIGTLGELYFVPLGPSGKQWAFDNKHCEFERQSVEYRISKCLYPQLKARGVTVVY